jgi:hypothetical protein
VSLVSEPISFSSVSPNAIASYRRDGVVCLRGLVATKWIEKARRGVLRNLSQPGQFFRDHTPPGSPGRYVFDYWTWPDIPEFREVIFDSPLAEFSGKLMAAQHVNLVMDNWFMREIGATTAAPWHHDEPYFDFIGPLCVVWLPLEAAPKSEGLTFVRGSHRWGQLFVAPQFSANVPFVCAGEAYSPVPDIDAEPASYELLSWAVGLGDCLVFDFRTLHSTTGKSSPALSTQHRLSLRFGSETALFKPRGPWTEETSTYVINQGQKVDAPIDCPLMPRAWACS